MSFLQFCREFFRFARRNFRWGRWLALVIPWAVAVYFLSRAGEGVVPFPIRTLLSCMAGFWFGVLITPYTIRRPPR